MDKEVDSSENTGAEEGSDNWVDVDEDENCNVVASDENLCRFCGENIGQPTNKDKPVEKTEKILPLAFSKLYNIDVLAEDESIPKLLHRNCFKKVERAYKKSTTKSPKEAPPKIKQFVSRLRKCTGCNQYNTGHNRTSCPEISSNNRQKKRLMEMINRVKASGRCKEWLEYTEESCKDNNEDLVDVLAFHLRRELNKRGERVKATNFERIMKNEKTYLDPYSPRSTWSRQISSRRSWNQYKDEYKYGKQHKKQVLAAPSLVDIERFRVCQKNVPFRLTASDGEVFEYTPPQLPTKPNTQPGWKELSREVKHEQERLYRNELKQYKNKLRPDRIRPSSSLPESIRPNFIAVGNPYPNILAFSLFDIRDDILESLDEHPEVELEEGILRVDILGSDGCDGAAGYHMMSKPTERDIPDHALAYDFGVTEVSAKVKGKKIVLYDSCAVSVYNLQPNLRAACNENDHYATHSLTLPIENSRKNLCESSIEVSLSSTVLLKSESIEIITSKIDKKYADEQGGTGESNYPCNLCTASKVEIRDIKEIKKGFKLDRTYAKGVEVAEHRRVNIDKVTQDTLKIKSKGWKSVPILTSEYVRRGMDDLHDCTSWGRYAIKIMVRLRAGIWSEKVEGVLKALFDTAKKILRDEILKSIGIDIHLDLKGREAQALLGLKHHAKVLRLVPEGHQEDWEHFLSEARFALGIVCHPDPGSQFDLPSAEPRLKRFQIWLIETWPSFIQPDYVHPTLMHLIQLLTRPGALKSISQYGTQNKEAKNQKNNEYLATVARMNDLESALEDVYTRDSQASSVEIKKYGGTRRVQHCSKCKSPNHKANRCTGTEVTFNQKFIDLDLLDPLYKIRDKVNNEVGSDAAAIDSSDEEFELDEPEEEDRENNRNVSTPSKTVSFDQVNTIQLFTPGESIDSPAKRTRSKQKRVPAKGSEDLDQNPSSSSSGFPRKTLFRE